MKCFLAAAAMVFITPSMVAQTPAREPAGVTWDSARFAWEAGEYPAALEILDRLLAGSGADSMVRLAALLTGEYYTTRELAPDGRRL
ncbi:MAG: hypothetical protein M3Y31_04805, partial [Gemmatimonadota bacterium]|nr:hypothetical protein [Gemmatimonadota bacterium]